MTIYTGRIGNNFLKAEIEFQVVLPEFCENQEFKLFEETSEGNHFFNVFDILLNERENIATATNGVASYTGPITPNEVETIVIAQVLIEKSQIDDFSKRKFMLEVV